MKIRQIVEILDAKIVTCSEKIDLDVSTACGSDMMSDVLAFAKAHGILLTGLCNPQVVRTAEMMDMVCVCFVRGKKPDEMSISLAADKGIVLLSTDKLMYHACGLLFASGLNSEA